MHPEINDFISEQFYDGKLMTAPSVIQRDELFPNLKSRILFFNVSGFEERDQKSFKNNNQSTIT